MIDFIVIGTAIASAAYCAMHIGCRVHDKAVRRKLEAACGNPFIYNAINKH